MRLARTIEEWSQALYDSLAPAASSSSKIEARNITRQHDWNRLVRLIAHTLCDRLGVDYRERFDKLPPSEHTVPLVMDTSQTVRP